MKEFMKKIALIQKELKAPKGQYNNFGKYYYRNCEDILEALKPLLGDLVLTVQDEILLIGDRYYIKATAKITDGEFEVSNSALARESVDKKGMDDSQITGATSSYARKYALNGLLCIDDNKDADSQAPKKEEPKTETPKTETSSVPKIKIVCTGKNGQSAYDIREELKSLNFKLDMTTKQWTKECSKNEADNLFHKGFIIKEIK